MENTLKVLYDRMGIVADLKHSAALLNWDQQTYMPPKSITGRAQQLSTLQKTAHEILINKKTEKLLSEILPYKKQLSEEDIDYLTVLEENHKREKKIPIKIIEQFTIETSEGIAAWDIARKENNFKKFLPGLKKIINLSRKIADYVTFDEHPYDALLDQYEPGIKSSDLTPVFDQLAKKLTPMLAQYKKLSKFENLMDGINFSSKKQRELLKKLIKELGFNFNAGRFDESAHPFTTAFTCNDVRLTTRIDENDFRPAFYGAIHECGHGLYEQNIPERFSRTPLGEAASLGFHESQSRFYENIIGRSKTFWQINYKDWQSAFSIPENFNSNDLYRFVNIVKPSLIRVEADEVSYNLHIIIRFELERKVIAGEIKPEDLPEAWNELYKKYLGISVQNYSEGVLQDIHWAAGLFGYFPTYTIGNLISAQLKIELEKSLGPLDNLIRERKFAEIKEWFVRNIYIHGKRKKPFILLKNICGEKLKVEPFLNYISEKYDNLIKKI